MTKPGPGKFETCESLEIAEELYNILGISGQEKDWGDLSGGTGHFIALIPDVNGKSYITDEDEYGFFEYYTFDSPEEARREFESLATFYSDNSYPLYDEADIGREE